jgi:biopolymer transport protein TolR
MARNFRNTRHSAAPIAELNVTNLIDLAFMLLIIFMVATPLIQQEQRLPVNLPVAAKSPQTKVDPKDSFESITVRADGTYFVGSQAMTFPQLARELARFGAQPKPPVISLRTDARTTMQQIVSVLDEMKKNNLSRFQFISQLAK